MPLRRETIELLGGARCGRHAAPLTDITERLARLGIAFADVLRLADFPDDPTPIKTTLTLDAASSGTRPRELIDIVRLSTGGVTMLLDRLEAHTLISRTQGDDSDGRAVAVTLTRTGRESLATRLDRIGTIADEIVTTFG